MHVLQDKVQSATSAVQALDDEVTKQLHYIRADVKQAISVATSQLRSEVEAAAQARQQEDSAQLKEQLKGEWTGSSDSPAGRLQTANRRVALCL